jgi:hypothetical protein
MAVHLTGLNLDLFWSGNQLRQYRLLGSKEKGLQPSVKKYDCSLLGSNWLYISKGGKGYTAISASEGS